MALASLVVKIGADLSDLNKGLTEADRDVKKLGQSMSGNLTAPIRTNTTAITANATAASKAGASWNSLRGPLTSATRSLLELNPAVSQLTSVMGSMAVGAAPMVAVLAGIAAVSFGWNMLTKDARENKKATDEAIASLTALRDKQRLGSLSGTSAREAEKAGTELYFVQERLAELRSRFATQSAVGGGQETAKQVAELEQRQSELRSLIRAHENEVTQVRTEKANERIAVAKKETDAQIAELERLRRAQREYRDYLGELMDAKVTMPGASAPAVDGAAKAAAAASLKSSPLLANLFASGSTLPGLGGSARPDVSQIVTPLTELRQATQTGFAQVAVAIGDTLAQNLAGIFGGGRGAQIGGSILGAAGGKFASSAIAAGGVLGSMVPVLGTIAGTFLGSAVGSLFDHKRSVDANTAAVMRLTEAMYNEPSGFKVNRYRYMADEGVSGADLMRRLNRTADVFEARGGLAFAGGA